MLPTAKPATLNLNEEIFNVLLQYIHHIDNFYHLEDLNILILRGNMIFFSSIAAIIILESFFLTTSLDKKTRNR